MCRYKTTQIPVKLRIPSSPTHPSFSEVLTSYAPIHHFVLVVDVVAIEEATATTTTKAAPGVVLVLQSDDDDDKWTTLAPGEHQENAGQ